MARLQHVVRPRNEIRESLKSQAKTFESYTLLCQEYQIQSRSSDDANISSKLRIWGFKFKTSWSPLSNLGATRHGLLKVWSPLFLIYEIMKSHQPILNDGGSIISYIFSSFQKKYPFPIKEVVPSIHDGSMKSKNLNSAFRSISDIR